MWDCCIVDFHIGELTCFLFSYLLKPTTTVLGEIGNSEQSDDWEDGGADCDDSEAESHFAKAVLVHEDWK